MLRTKMVVCVIVLGLLMMGACQAPQTTVMPSATPVEKIAPTPTESPTSTPEPTATPLPPTATPTPEPTAEPTDLPVKKIANRPYIDDGNSSHKLDIYVPEVHEGPLTTLLILPGMGQNRATMATQARYFAGEGFASVVISYRDAWDNMYPIPVQDAFCALGWVHSNAAEYGFDPANVFVTGFLYGATQGALIGTVDDPATYLVDCPHALPETNWVHGTMMVCGTFDYTGEEFRDFSDPSVRRSFGGTYEEAPALSEAGSPVTWADSDDPPVLWVCGEDIQDVPDDFKPATTMSHAVIERKITETGIPATVSFVQDKTWGSYGSEFVFAAMEEFLLENQN